MIIDGHSHIGDDYYNGLSSLDTYLEICKKTGVTHALIMPVPWPKFVTSSEEVTSLVWSQEQNGKINYYQLYRKLGYPYLDNRVINLNPYAEVNQSLNRKINLANREQSDVLLHFVPLIHGVLDQPQQIEELILKYNPIALKIHGFSGGYHPALFNPKLVEIIRKSQIPLIIHTSVYMYDYGYGFETKEWRNLQHPCSWADFLINNGLTGVLNHGVALDSEAIKLANDHDNIFVGIGPDLNLASDYLKHATSKSKLQRIGYLKLLRELVDASKLVFDLDFSWNVDESDQLDDKSVERITTIFGSQANQVLCDNAKRLYRIK